MCIRDREKWDTLVKNILVPQDEVTIGFVGKYLDLKESYKSCLLYTSDAADERSSVDLGGRRIIKKKTEIEITDSGTYAKIEKKHIK